MWCGTKMRIVIKRKWNNIRQGIALSEFFFRLFFLAEGNQQIQGKVPYHYHTDGKEF